MQFSFSKLILTFLCLFLYVFSLMCFRTSCAICPFFSQRPFLFVSSLFVGTIGWGTSTTSSSATSSSISAGDLTRMAGQTTWYHSFQIVLRRIVAWLALLYNSSTFLAYVVRTSAIACYSYFFWRKLPHSASFPCNMILVSFYYTILPRWASPARQLRQSLVIAILSLRVWVWRVSFPLRKWSEMYGTYFTLCALALSWFVTFNAVLYFQIHLTFCQGECHQHDNVFSPWSLQSCLCVFGSGGYPFPYGNVRNIFYTLCTCFELVCNFQCSSLFSDPSDILPRWVSPARQRLQPLVIAILSLRVWVWRVSFPLRKCTEHILHFVHLLWVGL